MNTFLLARDKFTPEMDLKQHGFTCGLFTKNKERIGNFMLTGNTNYTYRNELGKSNHLAKITQSDKFLRNKAFKIVSDPKYDGYQRGLASMVHNSFYKTSSGSGIVNEPNYQLANELQRPIIRKFK